MSEHKRYTADEMCDAADWFKREDQHAIAPEIEQMLRYAAAMVERCEKIKVEQPFDSVINTANYILRGDAGKEETHENQENYFEYLSTPVMAVCNSCSGNRRRGRCCECRILFQANVEENL